MESEQPKKHHTINDYNFNLKIVMFLVAIEVFILVSISFVKIYVDKKHSFINSMRDEVEVLEKIFIDHTDYSSYVLSQMAYLIKDNYKNSETIDDILSHYSLNVKQKDFFGWQGFYWLDKDGRIKNTNIDCTMRKGTRLNYLSSVRLSKISPGKIFYGPHPNNANDLSSVIDLVLGVKSDEGEFIGTLFLQTDTSTILTDLEKYRRHETADFAIIDNKLNIVVSYPLNNNRIGSSGKHIISTLLQKDILKLNFSSDKSKEISYIDMIRGNNFFVKKIRNKPYAIIVSINPSFIKTTLTKKIALKFTEIIILASFFLVLALLVYKRETWLRAKAEKASQIATKAMVAKSDFLSYTAHEIRSPLGFILTGSEIMNKELFGPIPKLYQDYVAGIHHNSRLILDFINEILDERHLANGNFKLSETVCNIADIVEKAILTNKTRFHERKIAIEKIIEPNLPPILGDARKILQALSNLISNAYKYSLDNTKITVEARVVDNKLKLIVSDQGIGMTAEDIKIALTKYGTAHGHKPGNFIESYGLGLPIVVMLTKAHNAELDIESEVDFGTKITITFPKDRIIRNEN